MPEISRFYGIVITMYADDHNPPHFHIRYAEFVARIIISTGDLLDGNLPKRQLRLVQAWVEIHREELMKNWAESQKENPDFLKIEPLI